MIERTWSKYAVVLQTDQALCLQNCPGSDNKLSAEEHLAKIGLQLADNLLYIRNSSWKIRACFSTFPHTSQTDSFYLSYWENMFMNFVKGLGESAGKDGNLLTR